MGPRTVRAFAAAFFLTSCLMASVWSALDVLLNLDEILADSGPDSPFFRVAVRHGSAVIRLQGPALLGAIALGSSVAGLIEIRKKRPGRSGSLG